MEARKKGMVRIVFARLKRGAKTGQSRSFCQALQATTLYLTRERTPVTTNYGYDPSDKRLKTITLGASNPITATYSYFPNSNQVQYVNVLSSGGAGAFFTYAQDSTDPARISQLGVSSNGGSFTAAVVNGFNQQDQLNGQRITTPILGTTNNQTDTWSYGYQPSQGDALTRTELKVTGTVIYSISDQNWVNASTGTTTDRFQFGYDADGNVSHPVEPRA